MHVIQAVNVNDALRQGLDLLTYQGAFESSRNGAVLVAPWPVCTVYRDSRQRVLANPVRDANPFFHLFESIWMLAGRNDVAFPARYAKQLLMYAEQDGTMNGAYGYRWRCHFGYDQLPLIIEELRRNKQTRRCVLTMWDGGSPTSNGSVGDLQKAIAGSNDVPCNTQVYFRVRGSLLDMTVTCRSNDIIWGAYGANAVHFSVLHEFIANATELEVGRYYQMSNNYHAYTERDDFSKLVDRYVPNDIYAHLTSYRLMDDSNYQYWLEDAEAFIKNPHAEGPYHHSFFDEVARPMAMAHAAYKVEAYGDAMRWAGACAAEDWRYAAIVWFRTRSNWPMEGARL